MTWRVTVYVVEAVTLEVDAADPTEARRKARALDGTTIERRIVKVTAGDSPALVPAAADGQTNHA